MEDEQEDNLKVQGFWAIGICLGLILLNSFVAMVSEGAKEPIMAEEETTEPPIEYVFMEESEENAPEEALVSSTEALIDEKLAEAKALSEELKQVEARARTESQQIAEVNICEMKNLGIRFPCSLSDKVMDISIGEDQKVLLSEDPVVTLSWREVDGNVRFLGQLSTIFFEKSGAYSDGFRTQREKFAGREAVLVKGYPAKEPQAQVRDYFYLYNDKLINVSFTLSPSERWDEGKFIIKEVKDQFAKMP